MCISYSICIVCTSFGNFHQFMVLQNLYDLLDPSYWGNFELETTWSKLGFLKLGTLPFRAKREPCWRRGCPVHHRRLGSFSGLFFPIVVSSTLPLLPHQPHPQHRTLLRWQNVSDLPNIPGVHREVGGFGVCVRKSPLQLRTTV